MADFILYLTGIIKAFGYLGIFIATAFEYACFPVSSEILLPFIGYSVFLGRMSYFAAVFSSTLGAFFGCSFCYGLGRFGVRFIEGKVYDKFPSLKEGIKKAEGYFNKIGRQSVFFGRLMPIVRTYISFPAGMAKMKYSTFLFFSILGAFVWNIILIGLGYLMGEHWKEISVFFSQNKTLITLIVLILFLVLYLVKKKHN